MGHPKKCGIQTLCDVQTGGSSSHSLRGQRLCERCRKLPKRAHHSSFTRRGYPTAKSFSSLFPMNSAMKQWAAGRLIMTTSTVFTGFGSLLTIF